MEAEDLKMRLMMCAERIDEARLALIRRRMVPGATVRIRKDRAMWVNMTLRETRHKMVLKGKDERGWYCVPISGPHKGRESVPLPECVLEIV